MMNKKVDGDAADTAGSVEAATETAEKSSEAAANQPVEKQIPPSVDSKLDPTQFGIFGTARIVQEGDITTCTIPLGQDLGITIKAPTPVAAAWMTDNVAGKLLADAKKSKVG